MKITVPVTLRKTWDGPVKDIKCPICRRLLTLKSIGVENPCHAFYITTRNLDEVAIFDDGHLPEAA